MIVFTSYYWTKINTFEIKVKKDETAKSPPCIDTQLWIWNAASKSLFTLHRFSLIALKKMKPLYRPDTSYCPSSISYRLYFYRYNVWNVESVFKKYTSDTFNAGKFWAVTANFHTLWVMDIINDLTHPCYYYLKFMHYYVIEYPFICESVLYLKNSSIIHSGSAEA